jgi:alpha-L-fucosidase 2
MKQLTLSLFFVILLVSCNPNKTKIACMGDSITNGGGEGIEAFYPTQLDDMLGAGYEVLNLGESGATMLKSGNKPYWHQKDFPNVFVFQPDVITILLGTNDSKGFNWNAKKYESDYQNMIDTLRTLPTKPKIYLCSPPPAYSSVWEISDSTIQHAIIPIVNRLAEKNQLEIIDFYKGMANKSELFPDGIHPNNEGKKIMARIIADKILQ